MEFSTAGIKHAQADRQLRRHDHLGEAKHIGGAAHVLFHQQHAGGGLDVEAAGIETDALADQRHLRRARRLPQEKSIRRGARGLALPT